MQSSACMVFGDWDCAVQLTLGGVLVVDSPFPCPCSSVCEASGKANHIHAHAVNDYLPYRYSCGCNSLGGVRHSFSSADVCVHRRDWLSGRCCLANAFCPRQVWLAVFLAPCGTLSVMFLLLARSSRVFCCVLLLDGCVAHGDAG